MQYVKSTDITPSYLSDHAMPSITVGFEDTLARGKGRWMLNTSCLDSEEYVEGVKEIIQETKATPNLEATAQWDLIFMLVRGYSIKFGTQKARSDRHKLQVLEKKLYNSEINQAADIDLFTKESSEMQTALIHQEIEDIRARKVKGAMI